MRMLLADPEASKQEVIAVGPAQVSLLFLGFAVLPVAIGYFRRTRSQLVDTRQQVVAAQATTGDLSTELFRQQEREMIAREMHDGLGHRLSLVSLQAGALEVSAPPSSELAESARAVRENAQLAMDEVRSLMGVLREPATRLSLASLADLEGFFDEMTEAGLPVVASSFLTSADQASPHLAHAVYRIVQELVTNSRKHALGQTLRLRVAGDPQQGIWITGWNPDPMLPPSGPGNGLRGIHERAQALGGWAHVAREQGRFTVTVHLPWIGRTP